MKKFIWGLVIVILLLGLTGGAIYAYTALTVSSSVEVLEPISIASVGGDGTFDMNNFFWDTGQIYPMSTPSLTFTFYNAAPGPITLTLDVNPASLDGGNIQFYFNTTSLEVPAEGTASATLMTFTNQSLTPGVYGTYVTVSR